MNHTIMIGIMGCGKTTISKMLGEKLGRPVIDFDEYIVQKNHMSIEEMFAISEEYFRERESEVCRDLMALDGYIVSTGGGVIKRKENRELLKHAGTVFYIDRPIENIISDVDTSCRPLLKNGSDVLYELYNERDALYQETMHFHIKNDGSLEEVASRIIEKL